MSHTLIISATSDIAQAIARQYAAKGHHLYLTARNPQDIATLTSDLSIRHDTTTQVLPLDITATHTHQAFFDALDPKPQNIIIATGFMQEQSTINQDHDQHLQTLHTNFTGISHFLQIAANDLESQGQGSIIAITSVAGDRGRASNYSYGSAKAGLIAYLSGLRNRLSKKGIQVLDVRPGFVATKMTAHLDLPAALTASPTQVAKDIYKAHQKGKNVLYTKWIWRYIMLVIKNIPENIFKKLNL